MDFTGDELHKLRVEVEEFLGWLREGKVMFNQLIPTPPTENDPIAYWTEQLEYLNALCETRDQILETRAQIKQCSHDWHYSGGVEWVDDLTDLQHIHERSNCKNCPAVKVTSTVGNQITEKIQ